MSDYLDLVLSSIRDPPRSVRPRLPSIFEPLPLGIRVSGQADPVDRDGAGKNGIEYHGHFEVTRSKDDGWGSQDYAGSECGGSSGQVERNVEDESGRMQETNLAETGSGLPGQNDRSKRYYFHAEKPDAPDESRIASEKPEIKESRKAKMDDLSKAAQRFWIGEHITGELPNPNQRALRTEYRGSINNQGLDGGPADKWEDLAADRISSGRLRPAQDALSRLGPHLKGTALPKTRYSERRDDLKGSRPTIRVTIGRIEVRAVTRPKQPARNHPEKTRTSLEDYLRQRRGKDR